MFFKGTLYTIGGKFSYLIVSSTEEKANSFMETSSKDVSAISHSVELINSTNYLKLFSNHAKQFDGIQYVE